MNNIEKQKIFRLFLFNSVEINVPYDKLFNLLYKQFVAFIVYKN